jgi:hypothetical protein
MGTNFHVSSMFMPGAGAKSVGQVNDGGTMLDVWMDDDNNY